MKLLRKYWALLLILLLVVLYFIPPVRAKFDGWTNQKPKIEQKKTDTIKHVQFAERNWKLKAFLGDTVNFSSSKGHVIIINFWATWCPPCVKEMGSFQKLYNSYQDKIDFYFISKGNSVRKPEKPSKIKAFLKAHELSLPIFRALGKPPKPIDGWSLPTTYIISKSGEIIVEKNGEADWNNPKIRKLLDRLIGEK